MAEEQTHFGHGIEEDPRTVYIPGVWIELRHAKRGLAVVYRVLDPRPTLEALGPIEVDDVGLACLHFFVERNVPLACDDDLTVVHILKHAWETAVYSSYCSLTM